MNDHSSSEDESDDEVIRIPSPQLNPPWRHFMEFFNHCINGPNMSNDMIKEMEINVNCVGTEGLPSKLDFTKQQESYIQANLTTMFPFAGSWIAPPNTNTRPKKKKHRFHATHLEVRKINTLLAAIEFKMINYKQVNRPQFLLNILQPELDGVFDSLRAYHRLATRYEIDLFKLHLSIPYNSYWNNEIYRWDAVELMWPLDKIFENLRAHYRNLLCVDENDPSPYNSWRDAGEENKNFQKWLVTLVQVLWLGIHPFR